MAQGGGENLLNNLSPVLNEKWANHSQVQSITNPITG